MSNSPKCPYCGGEMIVQRYGLTSLRNTGWSDTKYCYQCVDCEAESPLADTEEAAYAAAMKRENKYREQVEFDVKAALNALNRISYQMPYHIFSMLYDKIAVIGYTPTNCGADMRKEARDDER